MMNGKVKGRVCAASIAVVMCAVTVLAGKSVANAAQMDREDMGVQQKTSQYASVTAGEENTVSMKTITTGVQIGTAAGKNSSGTNSSTGTIDSSTFTTNAASNASDIVYMWVPQTAEEKKLYSYVGKEKIVAAVSGGTTAVTIANSVQGPKAHAVFESVLGDYTIGRTYNIFPGKSNLKDPVYETKEKVTITMEIPKTLQKEGRKFRMICVSEKGIPYILENTSTDSTQITFTTNCFYAYALCYVD